MKFDELKLNENILKSIFKIDYTDTTPIQEKAIPSILKGNDFFGVAQTGTGKSAAFLLPILNMILANSKKNEIGYPKALILVPFKELAIQIMEVVQVYSKYIDVSSTLIFGGVLPDKQIEELKNPVDILIATPARLNDFIKQKIVDLSEVEYFVLDEVDRMLDRDSMFELRKILKLLPVEKQSMFFSATSNEDTLKLTREILREPVIVKIEPKEIDLNLILQNVLFVDRVNKDKLLIELIKKDEVKSVIIFTNTKSTADDIVRIIVENKVKTEALHSGKSFFHRAKVVRKIKSKIMKVLVSTNLGSRGLDIDGITHIINYDVPTNSDDYIHRIGRCGRNGKTGIVYTLCIPEQRNDFSKIEQKVKSKINILTHGYHSEKALKAKGKDAKKKNKKGVKNNFNKNSKNKKYTSHSRKSGT